MDNRQHIHYLKKSIDVSKRAKANGNTPFGAILVGPDGEILLEQENIEVVQERCTGHAETALMEKASKLYSKDFLWQCTLYSSVEPCAMCAGAIYWGNVGKVVYGLSEKDFLKISAGNDEKPSLNLPCRDVFSAGQKGIEVLGPFDEVREDVIEAHKGYWQ